MTAIANRDTAEFIRQATFYIGVFAAFTIVAVVARFIEERLALLWREFLTRRAINLYLADGTYYHLDVSGQLTNPDQRIAEDMRAFTVTTLSFILMVLNSGLTIARLFRCAVVDKSLAVCRRNCVCGLRFVPDDCPWAPAHQAELRPARQGGQLPLQPHSSSRKRQIHYVGALRRTANLSPVAAAGGGSRQFFAKLPPSIATWDSSPRATTGLSRSFLP